MEAMQNLLRLQELDYELDRIEKDKGDLPLQIERSTRRLAAATADFKSLQADFEEAEREKKRLEAEIEMLRVKKQQNEEKLYSVTTNREYDAVTLEIEAVMSKIDECETSVLELIEKLESLDKRREELALQVSELAELNKKQSADLQARIERNAERERHLRAERERIAAVVPRAQLRLYERIRSGKDGLALVAVVRGACGGCFTQIPPQRMMEVRDQDRLITCESCGRILYWSEKTASQVAAS